MHDSYVHQLCFVRHAQTTYSNIYPDITSEGANELKRTAENIRPYIHNELYPHFTVVASPAVRAQGSASVLREELQHTGNTITEPLLRDMTIHNWPRAKEIFDSCVSSGKRVEEIYEHDHRFENRDIFEPRTMIQNRFFQYIQKFHDQLKQSTEPQCVLAVSHFEVLNHFLHQLWNDAPWLRWSGTFRMEFEHPRLDEKEKVMAHYAGLSREVDIREILQQARSTVTC